MIGDSAAVRALRKYGVGLAIRTTTVRASGVSISWILAKLIRSRGPTLLSARSENLTSSAVKGTPSCHLTPGRSENAYWRPSGETLQAVASKGLGVNWESNVRR